MKKKGWKYESTRHGLAAKGIKTGRKSGLVTTSSAGFIFEDANDSTPEELSKAHQNYSQLQDGWCSCNPKYKQAYFRKRSSGYHGWMCMKCRKLVQVG